MNEFADTVFNFVVRGRTRFIVFACVLQRTATQQGAYALTRQLAATLTRARQPAWHQRLITELHQLRNTTTFTSLDMRSTMGPTAGAGIGTCLR
jgi:hypothetical protein